MSNILTGKVRSFNTSLKILRVKIMDITYIADKKVVEHSNISKFNEGDTIKFIPKLNKNKQGEIPIDQIITDEEFESKPEYKRKFSKKILLEPPDYKTSGEYFNNPYNFVSPIKPANESVFFKPFKPLDSFDGLSGIITCHLETLTPFFTCDPKTMPEEEQQHKKIDYFSLDDKNQENRTPTIVGSTLRGAIRSVCEGVTNSTFTLIKDQRLSYRTKPGLPLSYGRIKEMPQGTKNGKIEELREIGLSPKEVPTWAKSGLEGWVDVANNNKLFYETNPNDSTKTVYYGFFSFSKTKPQYQKTQTEELVHRFFYIENEIDFEEPEAQDYNKIVKEQRERAEATLKKLANNSNDKIAKKLQELLKRDNYPLAKGMKIHFCRKNGNAVNLHYAKVPRWLYKNSTVDLLDEFFHPVTSANNLCPTTRLFGFVTGKNKTSFTITEKCLDNLKNQGVSESIFEILKTLKNCRFTKKEQFLNTIKHKNGNQLSAIDESLIIKECENKKGLAYASRISFSNAHFIGDEVIYTDYIPLEILSSPKPTTYEFYLTHKDNPNEVWTDKTHKSYDDPDMKIRGRKFYWHQIDNSQYRWQNKIGVEPQNSQNSTVRLLAKDNKFEFKVRFENLEPYELGMLLWSLALEDGLAHKIGMGKPLGLGSVKINIENLQLIDRTKRYETLFNDPENDLFTFNQGIEESKPKANNYIAYFKEWMKEHFTQDFESLPNVKDLKTILTWPPKQTLPIHYPLCLEMNSENHLWFVENRRPNNIKNAQNLPFAVRIVEANASLRRFKCTDKKEKRG